ncbi:hypothetical protein PSPO01_12143 [Paraphaeosphaeria sporulosa]
MLWHPIQRYEYDGKACRLHQYWSTVCSQSCCETIQLLRLRRASDKTA